MDCSMQGLPVHHQLPEFAQTQVHRVGDAIQLSHPLWSPSPPAFNLSHHRVFSNKPVLRIRWPKDWSFSFSISPSNERPGLICFRMDWLDLLAVQGTLKSPSDCKEIKPVSLKGNQPWIFIGRTHAEAEAPVLWPPDVKSQLTGKDPDAGKD